MNPFSVYTIYQAERAQSERERRQADVRAGELAADFSRVGTSLARPAHALRDRIRRIFAEVPISHVRRGLSATDR
jgi:hypothetical protein